MTTKFDDLNEGDYLSETQYYLVKKKALGEIIVSNERGFEFSIGREIVEEGLLSAGQYTSEQKVSRTAIVQLLEDAKDRVFTVNFNKLPSEKSVLECLKKVAVADLANEKALKKLSKEILIGETRTLIGHLDATEAKMGRSTVTDLEIPVGQHRQRLVDHRTINWLIIGGVKYLTK